MTQFFQTFRSYEKIFPRLLAVTFGNIFVQTISRVCQTLLMIFKESLANGRSINFCNAPTPEPIRRDKEAINLITLPTLFFDV